MAEETRTGDGLFGQVRLAFALLALSAALLLVTGRADFFRALAVYLTLLVVRLLVGIVLLQALGRRLFGR